MTKIYLIRHAEADGNIFQFSQGRYDAPLTDWGWKQVAALEERFRNTEIDACYSSSLYRARATASAIYKPKGLDLKIDDGVIEMDMGDRDILPVALWNEYDHDQLVAFFDDENAYDASHVAAGGEGFGEIAERLEEALFRIAKAEEGKTAAIVSHGAITRVFYAKLLGKTQKDVPYAASTSVSLLQIENGRIEIVYLNDASHLEKAGLSNSLGIKYKENVNDMSAALIVGPEGRILPDGKLRLEARQFKNVCGYMDLDVARSAEDKAGYISDLWLDEEFRGRNLAKGFIGKAIIFYRPLGYDFLQLSCDSGNAAALKFFRRYDFKDCGTDGEGKLILKRFIGYRDI